MVDVLSYIWLYDMLSDIESFKIGTVLMGNGNKNLDPLPVNCLGMDYNSMCIFVLVLNFMLWFTTYLYALHKLNQTQRNFRTSLKSFQHSKRSVLFCLSYHRLEIVGPVGKLRQEEVGKEATFSWSLCAACAVDVTGEMCDGRWELPSWKQSLNLVHFLCFLGKMEWYSYFWKQRSLPVGEHPSPGNSSLEFTLFFFVASNRTCHFLLHIHFLISCFGCFSHWNIKFLRANMLSALLGVNILKV